MARHVKRGWPALALACLLLLRLGECTVAALDFRPIRLPLRTELTKLSPELLDRRGLIAHHDPPKAPPRPRPSVSASERAKTDGGTIARPPNPVKPSAARLRASIRRGGGGAV